MTRVLKTSVSLEDPDRPGFYLHLDAGTPDTHPVGDATLADRVSNPGAWTTPADTDQTEAAEAADLDPDADDAQDDADDDQDDADDRPAGQEPPRSGKGATAPAWAQFARDLGVDPGDRTKAVDIQALLLEQGLIDEE